MEIDLETILGVYFVKAQTHDHETTRIIKTAIQGRYNLTEDQFRQHLDAYATQYVACAATRVATTYEK